MDIIEQLIKIQKELDEKDPLLQKNIGKDWVCVTHPALEMPMQQRILEKFGDTILTRLNWTAIAFGRPTYVQPTAPRLFEYMSPETYKERYGKLYHEEA